MPNLLPDNWEEFLSSKIDPRYAAWTRAAAERNNIPPLLLARLLYQESKYDKNLISPGGARGIGQLLDPAVKSIGRNPVGFLFGNISLCSPTSAVAKCSANSGEPPALVY